VNLEMAAERYRVEYREWKTGPTKLAWCVVHVKTGDVWSFSWNAAEARMIAAALNAAEDAGWLKAALEGLVIPTWDRIGSMAVGGGVTALWLGEWWYLAGWTTAAVVATLLSVRSSA